MIYQNCSYKSMSQVQILYQFHMRKQLLLASLVPLTIIATFFTSLGPKSQGFEEWKAKYAVSWTPEQETYRKIIFEKNLLSIEQHNANPSQTYKMGVNQFTVYVAQEFAQLLLKPIQSQVYNDEELIPVDIEIDWVSLGKVTNVKNQAQSLASYAFSAAAVIESFNLIQGIGSFDLSEQQLIDCSKSYGNSGCSSGLPSNALNYVKANGITTESAYPYVAKDQACKIQGGATKISGEIRHKSCNGLYEGIKSHPISVTVDASSWQFYKSGVLRKCSKKPNHAVLLVGLVEGKWKIKNSWGTTWGEDGYIRLSYGNTCGICINSGLYPQ